MNNEIIETSIFPLIKQFKSLKSEQTGIMIKEEMIIHGRCFRTGTVFNILGWKEIDKNPYVILSKGSWEGLVEIQKINNRIVKINGN